MADGTFAILLIMFGIDNPGFKTDYKEYSIGCFKWYLGSLGKLRKGKSTLKKWSCPVCGFNVRIGINGNPQIRYDPCEQKTGYTVFFVSEDGFSIRFMKMTNPNRNFHLRMVKNLSYKRIIQKIPQARNS